MVLTIAAIISLVFFTGALIGAGILSLSKFGTYETKHLRQVVGGGMVGVCTPLLVLALSVTWVAADIAAKEEGYANPRELLVAKLYPDEEAPAPASPLLYELVPDAEQQGVLGRREVPVARPPGSPGTPATATAPAAPATTSGATTSSAASTPDAPPPTPPVATTPGNGAADALPQPVAQPAAATAAPPAASRPQQPEQPRQAWKLLEQRGRGLSTIGPYRAVGEHVLVWDARNLGSTDGFFFQAMIRPAGDDTARPFVIRTDQPGRQSSRIPVGGTYEVEVNSSGHWAVRIVEMR